MNDIEFDQSEGLNSVEEKPPFIETSFRIAGKDEVSFIESYVEEKIEENPIAGDFFIVLELVGMTAEEGEDIGESFIRHFGSLFYSNLEVDPYTRFEEGLSEVNKVAEDLAAEHALDFKKLNISIGAVIEDLIFVSTTCDAEIYIVRKGTVKNVAEGIQKSKNEEDRLFCNVASGNLEKGDTVLLTTARLVRYIANSELGRCFFNRSVDTGVDYLEDILRMEVVGRVGILAVRVNDFNIDEQEYESKVSKINFGALLKKDGVLPKVLAFSRYAAVKIRKFVVLGWNFSLRIASKIATLFAGRKIDFKESGSKLAMLAGGGIIVAILLVSYVVFSISFISIDYKEAKAGLVSAENALQSARSESNKQKAIKMLVSVEENLEIASEYKSLNTEVDELRDSLNEVRSLLDDVVVVKAPMVAADVSKSSKGDLQGVVTFGQTMYAYDNTNAYEFLSGIVKDPVQLLEDKNDSITSLAYFEDAESLIYMLKSGKLKEYTKGVDSFMTTTDSAFKKGVDIVGYGPRLYVLDPAGNQIWKYQKRRDSYGPAESYVKSVNNSGFTGAVSMTIDGSVYVLFESGKIEKYYAGEKVPEFQVLNQPLTSLNGPTQIYTDLSMPFVFVLEPESKRILVYAKDSKSGNLNYTNQYYFQDLSEITGFAVDYTKKKLYVSDSKKVYATNLVN